MRPATLLVCLPLSTLADPSPPTNTNLQPWQITSLNTFTPSGRSGNPPYSSLTVTIADLNTIPLGKTHYGEASFNPSNATCTTKWNSYINEDPFDKIIPCQADNFNAGRWTMVIQKANVTGNGPSATRDFRLKFELEESMMLNDGIVRKTFVGTAGFVLGENLRIICGGSGVCSTWLREEMVPQLVVQEGKTECLVGVCGEV